MKIRIPIISYSPLIQRLLKILPPLEDALNSGFKDDYYGADIEQFTINVVAVDADELENSKWSESRNKINSFKDPITKKRTKQLSISLPFNPYFLNELNDNEILRGVSGQLITKLGHIGINIPKAFDYLALSNKLRMLLQIYVEAT